MKKIMPLSLALIILLTGLTACLPMKNIRKNSSAQMQEPVVTEEREIETQEVETEEVEPIVLSDYLGNWHPGKDSGNVELRILSADSYFVEFSLWYLGEGNVSNVNAVVNGSTASFKTSDSGGAIAGKLSFKDSYIELDIDTSYVGYIKEGTTKFDGRHSTSYQEEEEIMQQGSATPDPYVPGGIVAPTHIVSPYFRYVNTPNNILYLRKGPAKSYEGIEKMPDRSRVEVYGYNDDGSWVYVYYDAKGTYGWCSDDYLTY